MSDHILWRENDLYQYIIYALLIYKIETMELRHLRYFVTVAQELHFGRAAEKLHIAQPALSIQIKTLEEQLGGSLFQRTSRSVALTEAGERVLKEAKQTLYFAERTEKIAKLAFAGDIGRLSIAYSGSVTYSGLLGLLIQSFRQLKPDIELKLIEMDPFTQLQQLQQGEIDLGLLSTFSLNIPDHIQTYDLASWPPCVALPATHPLAHQDELTMEQLQSETFITYSRSPNDDGANAIRALADYTPNIIHPESNIMSVLALVGSGMGISIVPSILSKTLNQPGLIFRSLKNVTDRIGISMAIIEPINKPSLQSLVEHIHCTKTKIIQ